MRKMFAGLTVAAFAIVMTVPVFAKTETVTGPDRRPDLLHEGQGQ